MIPEIKFVIYGTTTLFVIIIFASNIMILVDGIVYMYNNMFRLFKHAFKNSNSWNR